MRRRRLDGLAQWLVKGEAAKDVRGKPADVCRRLSGGERLPHDNIEEVANMPPPRGVVKVGGVAAEQGLSSRLPAGWAKASSSAPASRCGRGRPSWRGGGCSAGCRDWGGRGQSLSYGGWGFTHVLTLFKGMMERGGISPSGTTRPPQEPPPDAHRGRRGGLTSASPHQPGPGGRAEPGSRGREITICTVATTSTIRVTRRSLLPISWKSAYTWIPPAQTCAVTGRTIARQP